MTPEEYRIEKSKIEMEHRKRMNTLHARYAQDNNNVQVGDFVSDHMCTIKVDRISVYLNFLGDGMPSCVYHGIQHTKKGSPYKNGQPAEVYQANVQRDEETKS